MARKQDGSTSAAAGHAAAAGGNVTEMFTRGAEAWLDSQAAALARLEETMQDWIARRHAAIQESYEALHRLRECRDFADMAVVQQQWLAGTMQRLTDDLGSFGTTALDASHAALRQAHGVAQAAGEGTRRAGEEALGGLRAAAGSKPGRER
jgi:hypothetical protein